LAHAINPNIFQESAMKQSLSFVLTAVAGASLLALAACGGGGGGGGAADTSTTDDPDAPLSLTGTVMVDGAIRNAVVCLDLNANSVCDAGEPASVSTGADGAYSLTTTSQQLAGASLIAPMVPGDLANPGTTIDMADGGAAAESPYVLRQVPGKAGQINPLTTLVAAGVRAGMTESEARTNAAAQLGIDPTKIDSYQDDPAFGDQVVDNARMMASVVASALEDGAVLSVGDQDAAVQAVQNDLRSLRYTDAGNHSYQEFLTSAKAAGTPGISLVDGRAGQVGGVGTDPNVLYNQAYLTSAGWLRCDSTVPLTATLGSPNRSSFCNAQTSVSYRTSVSVAGRSMADVVTELQSDGENFINTGGLSTTGLLAALGAAQFPASSNLRPGLSLNLTQPIFINSINTDGRPQVEATSLDELIAAKQAAGVDLATAAGSLSLGLGSGPLKNLRVAFTGTSSATSGTVQYYECDLNAAQTVASNCMVTLNGSYDIVSIHGARVMRFAGFAPTVMDHVRHYVEVNPGNQVNGVIGGEWVFVARQRKPDFDFNFSRTKRLNGVGWTAMRQQLGL
jgi:hypothetical protein